MDLQDVARLCGKCEMLFATTESLQRFADASDGLRGVYHGQVSELMSNKKCALCSLIVKNLDVQLSTEFFTKGSSIADYESTGEVWLGIDYFLPLDDDIEFPVPWDAPLSGLEATLQFSGAHQDEPTMTSVFLSFSQIPGEVDSSQTKFAPDHLKPLYGFYPSLDFWKDAAFTQPIRNMVAECRQHHSRCRGTETPFLPRAVLDVSTCHSNGVVRLHEASAGEQDDYVALSYCWGGPQKIVTTKKNRSTHQGQGILLADLPRSIADAASITAQLGISYLWVDALCIAQDDSAEKAREIENMGDIYSNATLVVLVSGLARAADDGFLHYLDEIAVVPVLSRPAGPDEGPDGDGKQADRDEPRVVRLALCRNTNFSPPLDGRGWTFQERHLSSRRLECRGAAGISFRCIEAASRFACNAWVPDDVVGSNELFYDNGNKIGLGRDGVSTWHELVTDYCFRLLSFKEDRLPAIAGLAKRHAAQFQARAQAHAQVQAQAAASFPPSSYPPAADDGDTYLAGLWKSQIIDDLMWAAHVPEDLKLSLDDYRQPGWSWLSVLDHRRGQITGGVSMQMKNQNVVAREARLVGHDLRLAQPDAPFGHVLSGTLVLRAKIALASAAYWVAPRSAVVDDPCAYHLTDEEKNNQLHLLWLQSGQMYHVLSERRQYYDRGLLVLSCRDGSHSWKRLGTFTVWSDEPENLLYDWDAIGYQDISLI